jgi:hypothetical protein
MFVWTPQTAGEYRVAVSSRTAGAAQEQDWHAIDFQVAPPPAPPTPTPAPVPTPAPTGPVQFDVDTADPAGQVPMNVPVTLEAMGGAGLEYRFLLFYRGRPWRLLRNFGSDPSFVWMPNLRPGTYEVGVEVRNAGERNAFGVDTAMVEIVDAPLLECSRSGMQISCNTPPSGGELEYQWWIRGARTRWEVLRDYGQAGDTMSFTPTAGPGLYYVAIYAKPAAGSSLRARSVYRTWVAVQY